MAGVGDKLKCAGCLSEIDDKQHLTCHYCHRSYDLLCANITEQRFHSIMTQEHGEGWICMLCVSMQPKSDNSNTPVRLVTDSVTFRRGAAAQSSDELNMSNYCLDATAHNDTVELSDTQAVLLELRQFRGEFRERMDANELQIKIVNENIGKLSLRMDDSDRRMEKLEERLQLLERKFAERSEAESSNAELIKSVEKLKMELNDRDQDNLLNDIEISCVPELNGESLQHVVMILSNKLGVTLSSQDVVSVSRLGPSPEVAAALSGSVAVPSRPRLILVRLARKAVRDELLRAARVRKGVTTADTGLPPRRFYVNERLTKLNRHLFRQTREAVRQHNWRFVWTREGKIYVRRNQEPDTPRIRIRLEADLTRVFGSGSFGFDK